MSALLAGVIAGLLAREAAELVAATWRAWRYSRAERRRDRERIAPRDWF
jgi:hypothetical protein